MLTIDAERGKLVAGLLYGRFSTTGIHGKQHMPEDALPLGVVSGSLEHALFITLTVAIDYQRDADALWAASRRTFEDPETRFLFAPRKVHEANEGVIKLAMAKYKLAKKPDKDLRIWRTNAVTFQKKYNGSPLELVRRCDHDAKRIIGTLMSGLHEEGGEWRPDFPFLRGAKIGPLWVRMLRDNVGLELKRMDELPIPVDVHVARATATTGVVHGRFDGPVDELHKKVREAWKESVAGLRTAKGPMKAMDLDEALWHLSKYGCTDRAPSGECPHLASCDASAYCVKGKVIIGEKVDIDT